MKWNECLPISILGRSCRVFRTTVSDGVLTAMVAQEPRTDGHMRWHLSISFKGEPLRLPTWEEIKAARYKLCPDECYMAMILPPQAEFVNVHPTTMHLYEIGW